MTRKVNNTREPSTAVLEIRARAQKQALAAAVKLGLKPGAGLMRALAREHRQCFALTEDEYYQQPNSLHARWLACQWITELLGPYGCAPEIELRLTREAIKELRSELSMAVGGGARC
jgi:hypothetical protein